MTNMLKTPSQLLKSFYVFVFQVPLLADHFNCQQRIFRRAAAPKNLSEPDRLALMYQFRTPLRMTGGINIYRAHGLWHLAWMPLSYVRKYITKPVEIDTVMIWGKRDAFLGPNVPIAN